MGGTGARRRRARVQSGPQGGAPLNVIAPCPRQYTRARDFDQLIALVRDAERFLDRAGYSTAAARIPVLRGIYYGTLWSLDYRTEHSEARNAGFAVYTVTPVVDDPRPVLRCNLFEALQGSQDACHRDRRHLDFGHLVIGLHARLTGGRTVPVPAQGGTGLELCTWLGDLGGGCGMLAYERGSNPHVPAITKFTGSNFGGSINLEGDIAGFVVASPAGATAPAAPVLGAGPEALTDVLAAYLSPTGAGAEWNDRAGAFLRMYGAPPPFSGARRASLIDELAVKIEAFAVWYLINRLHQTARLGPAGLRAAAAHVHGAAHEIAEIFVDSLLHSHAHPDQRIQGRGPGPSVSAPGTPNAALEAVATGMEAAERAGGILDEAEETARDFYRRWFE